jgi:predicted MFS family arabinose efflux permease
VVFGKPRPLGILTVLALTNLFAYAARYALVGVYDDLRARYGLNDAQLGMLGMLFMLPHAAATLPYGWAGDRLDRRRVIAAGMAIAGVGGGAAALAPDYLTLGLTRALVGLGTAAVVPVANTILGQVFGGAEKARRMSVFNLGLFLGSVAGVVLGGKLGFPTSVIAFAIPGGALAAVIAVMAVPPAAPHAAAHSFGELVRGFYADSRELLRIKSLRWVIGSATAMAFAAGAFSNWLNDFLMSPSGKAMSKDQASTLLGLALVGGLAGILTGGQVSDRLARRIVTGRLWTIVLGMSLTLPFAIAALQLPAGPSLYAASIGTMFFISWYHAPMAASVDDLAPPGKTVAAQGLVIFTMHMLGTSSSSWVVGLVSDWRHSLYEALWLPTGMLVIAAACMVKATRSFAADVRRAL